MFFTAQNAINKENEVHSMVDQYQKKIQDLEEQLQIAHMYNMTQTEEFNKFEKLISGFLCNFRDENMPISDPRGLDF